VRILFVDHTSQISGAQYSLLELFSGLRGTHECELACPPGPLMDRARRHGIPVHRITGTDGSLRLHPRHTSRALTDITRTALGIRRLAAGRRADLVHANSIRAGLAAGLGAERPTIAHVRDCLPPGQVSAATAGLLGRLSTLLIANSAYTRDHSLAPAARKRTVVVYSPVDLDRFAPERIDRAQARRALALPLDVPVLGVVAQITPWKGQLQAVRALDRLSVAHPDAILLLVGSAKFTSAATRYDNTAYLAEIRREIVARGLSERVRLLGEREDVPELLRALDLLLVPSWEEPFGRSVAEGMAMGLPVLATNRGGPPEILRDEQDGRTLPPHEVGAWARAAAELLSDPARRAAMGASATRRVRECCGIASHVAGVLGAYERAARVA
jgi:glycosyltransferase involved in cell wall biosynthesis